MDKQIAEAKLDDLVKSKGTHSLSHNRSIEPVCSLYLLEPLPHNRRHRIAPLEDESGVGSNTLFRQDEAFEKYEMGGDQRPPPGSKVENQAASDMQSVRLSEYHYTFRCCSSQY